MALRKQTNSRDINYLSKDFDAIKEDLIKYLKRYFPDNWQDFNESSGGIAIMELMAYIGDTMSFQIDRQINEAFLARAVERKNIISLAESNGYKVKTVTPALADITVSATFLNSISAETMMTLKKGSRIVSTAEPANFEIVQDVDFSSDVNRTTIFNETGVDTTYSVSGVKAIAGRSKTFKYSVDANPKSFLSITLPDRLVTEITSLSASNGDEYFEVDNLARDFVFAGTPNNTSTSGDVAYSMVLKRVPNRFVTERESDGRITVRFGSGTSSKEDFDIIPSPDEYVLSPSLRGSASGFTPEAIDSTSFLTTNSLGNVPNGVVLDISYRVGGGLDTNVGSNLLKNFVEKRFAFNDPTATETYPDETQDIIDSLSITNEEAAYGGEAAETNDSIKENAINFVGSQKRCVTLQDYKARVMSIPSDFGSVFRVNARKDTTRPSGIEIILISRNSSGILYKSPDIMKNNIETYIKNFRSITDSVRFSDGNIVNLGVNFSIVPTFGVNSNEALIKAIYIIQEFFNIKRMDFGKPIYKSELMRSLLSQPEVATVPILKVVNITNSVDNREYSPYSYDIIANTKNDIIYFKGDTIPELKYPNFDIQGSVENG
jgi:hypothetical protein